MGNNDLYLDQTQPQDMNVTGISNVLLASKKSVVL